MGRSAPHFLNLILIFYSFSDVASGVTIVEPLLFEQAETNIVAATAKITKNLFIVGLLEGFLT